MHTPHTDGSALSTSGEVGASVQVLPGIMFTAGTKLQVLYDFCALNDVWPGCQLGRGTEASIEAGVLNTRPEQTVG